MKCIPKILFKRADGGENSGVTAYMLIEWKSLFSIGLLHFKQGSREAYHTHAFNAITWWLKGHVTEVHVEGETILDKFKSFAPSFKPKFTSRDCYHKIIATTNTWVLTFRGPWKDKWKELRPDGEVVLTHGRKTVSE